MSEDKEGEPEWFSPEQEEWLKEAFGKMDEMRDRFMPPELKRFAKPIYYKLDENKQPVPANSYDFAYDQEHFEQRKRVALTKLGPYVVTTVFLAIDHNFGEGGGPILFETMMWSEKETGKHEFFGDQWRYRTWDEAMEGHKTIVKLVEEGLLP